MTSYETGPEPGPTVPDKDLSRLLAAVCADAATDADRLRLERLLEEPENMAAYVAAMQLHSELRWRWRRPAEDAPWAIAVEPSRRPHDQPVATADAAEPSRVALGRSAPSRTARRWLSTRPWLKRTPPAAAAVLLLLSGAVLGAGASWAVVPRLRDRADGVHELFKTGFEAPDEVEVAPEQAVRLDRVPRTAAAYGLWRADLVRVAAAEEGVVPFAGRGMLAFERAVGPASFDGGPPHSCDAYRLVDLSPFRDRIAGGKSLLTLSARFKDASEPHEDPTSFVIRLRIFSRPPEEVTAYPGQNSALGYNVIRTHGGERSADWHLLSATTTVPSDAVFAVVHVSAARTATPGASEAATFARHYCDDVRLALLAGADAGKHEKAGGSAR